MGSSRVLATTRWHQGFGVLAAGTRDQRVPFVTREAAERIAARAREAGYLAVVFPDDATDGWSYRAWRPPKQRSGS